MKNFLFLLILVFISACSANEPTDSYMHDDVLLSKFHNNLDSIRTMRKGYINLDLANLTDFNWDNVYFFHSEETNDFISALTKVKWEGPNVPNSCERLVFVYNNKIIKYIDFNSESTQQFYGLPVFMYNCSNENERVIHRSNSKLIAFKYCERGSIQYALIPAECVNKYDSFKKMVLHGCLEIDENYSVK